MKYLKEELKSADAMTVNAKVLLAQTVFDKDDTIVQLKLLNKKMKIKLNSLAGQSSPIHPSKKVSENTTGNIKTMFNNMFK